VQYLLALEGCSLDKSIDRIDGTKGYVPGNLRWATAKEQAYNRKTTIQVEWNSEKLSFKEFAEKYTDLSANQALHYFKQGYSLEEIVQHKALPRGNRVRYPKLRAKT
jgi:hypothetical protein